VGLRFFSLLSRTASTSAADSHNPWQCGSDENTNALLRQYLPRNADLALFSRHELNAIAARLNDQPRKTLGWMTPNEAWAAQLKSFNVSLIARRAAS
jgi:IS30 family transposase